LPGSKSWGIFYAPPISKHVGDQLYELRANSKEGGLRVFYFFGPDLSQITAVHAVVKKRRKTNPDDIATAKKRRRLIFDQQVRVNVPHFDS
jgi:phage-related protein